MKLFPEADRFLYVSPICLIISTEYLEYIRERKSPLKVLSGLLFFLKKQLTSVVFYVIIMSYDMSSCDISRCEIRRYAYAI